MLSTAQRNRGKTAVPRAAPTPQAIRLMLLLASPDLARGISRSVTRSSVRKRACAQHTTSRVSVMYYTCVYVVECVYICCSIPFACATRRRHIGATNAAAARVLVAAAAAAAQHHHHHTTATTGRFACSTAIQFGSRIQPYRSHIYNTHFLCVCVFRTVRQIRAVESNVLRASSRIPCEHITKPVQTLIAFANIACRQIVVIIVVVVVVWLVGRCCDCFVTVAFWFRITLGVNIQMCICSTNIYTHTHFTAQRVTRARAQYLAKLQT